GGGRLSSVRFLSGRPPRRPRGRSGHGKEGQAQGTSEVGSQVAARGPASGPAQQRDPVSRQGARPGGVGPGRGERRDVSRHVHGGCGLIRTTDPTSHLRDRATREPRGGASGGRGGAPGRGGRGEAPGGRGGARGRG